MKTGIMARSPQILHVGPYNEEEFSINNLQKFIADNGYNIVGDHEEEYLSDPRRTAPDKLQTIIRYRVRRK